MVPRPVFCSLSFWILIVWSTFAGHLAEDSVFVFPAERRASVGDWSGKVLEGAVEFPELGRRQELQVAQSFLSPSEVNWLLERARHLDFELKPDSVDGIPTFEAYLLSGDESAEDIDDGDPSIATRSELRNVTAEIIAKRVLPFVRQQYGSLCSGDCNVCQSLIRRYLDGERRHLAGHQDNSAVLTIVVSLNSFGGDYKGGLFVAKDAGSARQFVPLQRGDAVFHSSYLFHGIDVAEGERWSWIMWLQRGEKCWTQDPLDWHRQLAGEGDPFAQYAVGDIRVQEEGGADEAIRMFQLSAEQGYVGAASKLGSIYAEGEDGFEKGMHWLKLAAAANDSIAHLELSKLLYRSGKKEEAISHMRISASLGNRHALAGLGDLARVRGDLQEAARLSEAADTPASLWNRVLVAESAGDAKGSAEEAMHWMRRAAALGSREACFRYNDAKNPDDVVLLRCLTMQTWRGDMKGFRGLLKVYKRLRSKTVDNSYVQSAKRILARFADQAAKRGSEKPWKSLLKLPDFRRSEL